VHLINRGSHSQLTHKLHKHAGGELFHKTEPATEALLPNTKTGEK